ncbi:hypothetical protein ACFLIM_50290, partial [Nonomuraea sp. M3C6]
PTTTPSTTSAAALEPLPDQRSQLNIHKLDSIFPASPNQAGLAGWERFVDVVRLIGSADVQ